MNPEPIEMVAASLDVRILNQIEDILCDAEETTRPLEIDPYRGQLFELFVTSQGAGYLDEGSDVDLTADGICRQLAERFGLRDATATSLEQQTKIADRHLAKMRLLWSLMRMWMEWTYAWERWPEFHSVKTEF